MDEKILAYAAGLIDGEGSVMMSRQKKSAKFRTPCVSIANTTWELVDFMREHFGGSISTKSKRKEHWKVAYQWQTNYGNAIDVLSKVLPYLREPSKRRRAEMLVSKFRTLTPRNGQYTDEQTATKLQFELDFLAS